MADIGKYRRARLIHRDYQIRTVDGTWLTVERDIQVTAPLRVTILDVVGGDPLTFAANDEIYSRTPVEARRAAVAQELADL